MLCLVDVAGDDTSFDNFVFFARFEGMVLKLDFGFDDGERDSAFPSTNGSPFVTDESPLSAMPRP